MSASCGTGSGSPSAKRRRTLLAAGALGLAALLAADGAPPEKNRPGQKRNATLLPNGWRIDPAGRHVAVGDFPISMVQSPDGCCAIVSTAGVSSPVLTVVDVERMMVRQSLEPGNAWLGLAFGPDGRRLYSSAGSDNAVDVFLWKDRRLEKEKRIPLGDRLETDRREQAVILRQLDVDRLLRRQSWFEPVPGDIAGEPVEVDLLAGGVELEDLGQRRDDLGASLFRDVPWVRDELVVRGRLGQHVPVAIDDGTPDEVRLVGGAIPDDRRHEAGGGDHLPVRQPHDRGAGEDGECDEQRHHPQPTVGPTGHGRSGCR